MFFSFKHSKKKAKAETEDDLIAQSGIEDIKPKEKLFYKLSNDDEKRKALSEKITQAVFDNDAPIIYHFNGQPAERQQDFITFFNGYFSHRLVELLQNNFLIKPDHNINFMLSADIELPKDMYVLSGLDDLGNALFEIVINFYPRSNNEEKIASVNGRVILLRGYDVADFTKVSKQQEQAVNE